MSGSSTTPEARCARGTSCWPGGAHLLPQPLRCIGGLHAVPARRRKELPQRVLAIRQLGPRPAQSLTEPHGRLAIGEPLTQRSQQRLRVARRGASAAGERPAGHRGNESEPELRQTGEAGAAGGVARRVHASTWLR